MNKLNNYLHKNKLVKSLGHTSKLYNIMHIIIGAHKTQSIGTCNNTHARN